MRLITSVICLGMMLPNTFSEDVTITRVIGTEFPGEYKHPATITELNNGDLYINGAYADPPHGIRRISYP